MAKRGDSQLAIDSYWHYQQFKDVAVLQELFNHSAPSVTLRYIGITQDVMDATMKAFRL